MINLPPGWYRLGLVGQDRGPIDGVFREGMLVVPDVAAGLITGKETVTYRQFPQAPPAPGWVTVDIRLCGICCTEIASFRTGHLHTPAVCGHEWAGTVAEAGEGWKVSARATG